MLEILFVLLLSPPLFAEVKFGTLSDVAREEFCSALLKRDGSTPFVPLNAIAVPTLLFQAYQFRLKNVGRRIRYAGVLSPHVQTYIDLLKRCSWSEENHELLRSLKPAYPPLVKMFRPESLPSTRVTEITGWIGNELEKVPPWIRSAITKSGRSLWACPGVITDHPEFIDSPSFASRCYGGAHQLAGGSAVVNVDLELTCSTNTILHEIFHLFDYTGLDQDGKFISDRDSFRDAFGYRKPVDDSWYYEKTTTVREAFAESLSRYYDSSASRRLLSEEDPELYSWIFAFIDRY